MAALAGIAGAYAYLTRPPAAPRIDMNAAVTTVVATTTPRARLFRIVPEKSIAEFQIGEILRGAPFTVMGTTGQIAGDIAIDAAEPEWLAIGEVRVNARTLKTDDPRRDGAISRFILRSEDPKNEFIVFAPRALRGVPQKMEEGKEFAFDITGDLTIAGVTRSTTFRATTTLEKSGIFTGRAHTTVRRADFGLTIPAVPFVARADENVIVRVAITAEPH